MKKLFAILLFGLLGCSAEDSERGCWEISVQKGLYECATCGTPVEILMDKVFVRCNITQSQARKIITDWGGIPNQQVNIDNGDGTETRIRSSYKPVYL